MLIGVAIGGPPILKSKGLSPPTFIMKIHYKEVHEFCDLMQGVIQIIENVLRFNLRKCKFTKFSACPQSPLDLGCFACQHLCFAQHGHAFRYLRSQPPTSENVPTPLDHMLYNLQS